LYSSGRARAEHLRNFLQNAKNTGEILAAASIYRDFLKEPVTSDQYKVIKEKIYKRFIRTIEVDTTMNEIFIIDKNGYIIASSDKTQEGKNKSADPYFINAKTGSYIKSVYYSKTTKKFGYTVSAPISDDNNNLLGISVIRYPTDGFLNIVQNENGLGPSEEYFLINKDRYFISPSKFLGGSVILSQKVVTENANNCFNKNEIDYVKRNGYSDLVDHFGSQTVENKDYRNVDVVATHFYIPETDWCLITKVDRSQLFSIADQLKFIYLLSFIGAIILFIIISFIITRSIVSPINRLQQGIKIVESGNFDYRFNVTSNDEIGSLSESFNKMTVAIKNSQTDIKRKVEEQTKDILKKSENLEDQQKATLNILEDVEDEKNISKILAQDLQKFQLAVANASDHIVITDTEGIILYANQSVETITGFDNKKIIGQKAGSSKLWGGLMPKAVYEKFWKTIKKERKIFTGEFNNKRANGEQYIAEAHVSPVLDSNGELKFFIGIERDITKAKEIDRMKTEFISLASHQLRTPLSAIKWFCEMLLNNDAGTLNKEQKEYLENISQSNERMIALVNSLLNVSRIESGRIIIEPKPTDLGKLIKETLTELDNKIKEKKLSLIISIHPGLPLINIDPKLIREVYKNFLTNSIKYTPAKGEVSIFISKKNDEIVSQISDTGYGIPEKEQNRVFQKLYRGENIIKIETDGNGLGLYLAKSIVDSSGGKIWFKSAEGKGTTFWFSLPLSGSQPKKGEVTIDS